MASSKSFSLFILLLLLLLTANLSSAEICQHNELANIQLQQQADGLLISGTSSSECKELELSFYCYGKENGVRNYIVQPTSGSWEQFVSYDTLREINCCDPLGKPLTLNIGCFDGDTIGGTFICGESHIENILCSGGECPNITLQATTPVCSGRTQDGSWPVQFYITSQPEQFTGNILIFFGDGESITLSPSETSHTHLYNCPYSEPDYQVSVVANGCATNQLYTDSYSMALNFPPCECPSIENISHEIQGCTATFSTNVSVCSESITEYIWNFGDGTAQTTNTLTSPQHTYNHNDPYTVTLTLAGAGDNCTSNTTINITQCSADCGNGIVEHPETCDGNCPTVCDDYDPCTSDILSGSADKCNVNCIFTRIFNCISGDGCCPPNCSSQNDSDCGSGSTGNDDNSSMCGIFDWCCWLLALFMILYVAFWVMWNNNILPEAWYVGVAALLAFLLWIFICEPTYCGVLTVLFAAGIVALAIMGVIALIPGAPIPPEVIPQIPPSTPAALLAVLTLVVIPLLFLVGSCVSDCNDFLSCLEVLWKRATVGQ